MNVCQRTSFPEHFLQFTKTRRGSPVGKRPFSTQLHERRHIGPRVLKKVDRNEKVKESAVMPVVAVANCHSLEPKIKSVTEKIENGEIDLLILVEVWEKTGKKHNYFKNKMVEWAEMKGLKYISCGARPSGKRGGGAGIIVNLKKFSLDTLEIHVPHNLEVK